MSKRVLFLGASYFQVPPIKYAKSMGYYAITCDYLPTNPGHKFADEYHEVNATDYEMVLDLAKKLKIDGIVAYASDPCAPIAAYVAEKMQLPGNPYESVLILARKEKFRDYLEQNNFISPKSCSGESFEVLAEKISDLTFPMVIKPVDSSGSKGVTVIHEADELKHAFNDAAGFTRAGLVIAEEYVEKDGYQIAGDGFVVDGQLKFRCFANEHFDFECNGLVPIGESFPYVGTDEIQNKIHDEIQRLLSLLAMRQGALNFDVRINQNGQVVIMEIGPRNGGNLIPEVTNYITGVDMVKYTVEAALGHDCSDLKQVETKGFYASYIMHAQKDGVLKDFYYTPEIKECILEEVRWFGKGDKVQLFRGSNCTLGTQILRFASQEQMLRCMDNMNEYQRIVLD
jgi:biotin carboxylase